MREPGFSPSPEKATYVVLANKHNDHQGVKDLICLALQGKRMQDQSSVRGFGVVIDEDHAAPSCFNHVSKTWINTLNLIRQVFLKSWEAEEWTLRMLVNAFLVSKATYGYDYLHLNRRQKQRVECLNMQAMHVMTGLAKLAAIDQLQIQDRLNTIKDQAESVLASRHLWQVSTKAGRHILQALGYIVEGKPALAPIAVAWDAIDIADHKLLAKNIRQNTPRRQRAVTKHQKEMEAMMGDGAALHWGCTAGRPHCNSVVLRYYRAEKSTQTSRQPGSEGSWASGTATAVWKAQRRIVDATNQPVHMHCYTDSRQAVDKCWKHFTPKSFREKNPCNQMGTSTESPQVDGEVDPRPSESIR